MLFPPMTEIFLVDRSLILWSRYGASPDMIGMFFAEPEQPFLPAKWYFRIKKAIRGKLYPDNLTLVLEYEDELWKDPKIILKGLFRSIPGGKFRELMGIERLDEYTVY